MKIAAAESQILEALWRKSPLTFDEIVAAAKEEPAVQWCTGLGPDESQPIVEAFAKAFPGVPEPNDFECSGEEASFR